MPQFAIPLQENRGVPVGEAAASIGTGLGAMSVAGHQALRKIIPPHYEEGVARVGGDPYQAMGQAFEPKVPDKEALGKEWGLREGNRALKDTAEALTYVPTTEAGKTLVGIAMTGVEGISKASKFIADIMPTGIPIATAIKNAVRLSSTVAGSRSTRI